jgi:hypothetical protein
LAVLLAAPLVADAQEQAGTVWRIGYLSIEAKHHPIDKAFESSMKNFGYVEGENLRRGPYAGQATSGRVLPSSARGAARGGRTLGQTQ